MSKGPGRLQRWLLATLPTPYDTPTIDDGALPVNLAAEFYQTDTVTGGQVSSIRRALRGLEATGKVRRWGPTRVSWWTLPVKPATHLDKQILVGIRETDRCDSCARRLDEVGLGTACYGQPSEAGVYKVRGLALCRDCADGTIDAISLASDGEFHIDRMPPIPCGQCGGALSEAGLRLVYINGAMAPRCDACAKRGTDRTLASLGIPPDWASWER